MKKEKHDDETDCDTCRCQQKGEEHLSAQTGDLPYVCMQKHQKYHGGQKGRFECFIGMCDRFALLPESKRGKQHDRKVDDHDRGEIGEEPGTAAVFDEDDRRCHKEQQCEVGQTIRDHLSSPSPSARISSIL